MARVLVTGATGNVGTELLPALQSRGIKTRAFVHRPEAAPAIEAHGAEAAVGDFADRESIEAAVDGVTQMLLLTPSDPDQPEWESNLIRIAADKGVERIVKHSVINADPSSQVAIYASHGRCEQALRESDLPHTIMRCNEFMQNLLLQGPSIAEEGAIYGTGVGARGMGLVDVRDVAAVATELLARDDPGPDLVTITGPESISFEATASELSAVLDRKISYVKLPADEFRSALIDDGTPAWIADALVGLYVSYGEGAAEFVTPTVQEVTGHEPRSLRQFASDHAAALLGG